MSPLRLRCLWFPILTEGTAPAHTSLTSGTVLAGRTVLAHSLHLPESTVQQREQGRVNQSCSKDLSCTMVLAMVLPHTTGASSPNPS